MATWCVMWGGGGRGGDWLTTAQCGVDGDVEQTSREQLLSDSLCLRWKDKESGGALTVTRSTFMTLRESQCEYRCCSWASATRTRGSLECARLWGSARTQSSALNN